MRGARCEGVLLVKTFCSEHACCVACQDIQGVLLVCCLLVLLVKTFRGCCLSRLAAKDASKDCLELRAVLASKTRELGSRPAHPHPRCPPVLKNKQPPHPLPAWPLRACAACTLRACGPCHAYLSLSSRSLRAHAVGRQHVCGAARLAVLSLAAFLSAPHLLYADMHGRPGLGFRV